MNACHVQLSGKAHPCAARAEKEPEMMLAGLKGLGTRSWVGLNSDLTERVRVCIKDRSTTSCYLLWSRELHNSVFWPGPELNPRNHQISNWEVLVYNWSSGPSNLVQKPTRICWTNSLSKIRVFCVWKETQLIIREATWADELLLILFYLLVKTEITKWMENLT